MGTLRKRTKNRPATPHEMWWWNDEVRGLNRVDKLNPKDLLHILREYFDELSDNPVLTDKASVSAKGDLVRYEQRDARAPTLEGFCSYLGVSTVLWAKWKNEGNELLVEQCQRIEDIIYSALFERGAIGEFNAMLVARKLKLSDHVKRDEVTTNITKESREFTVDVKNLSIKELKDLNSLVDKAVTDNNEREVIEAQIIEHKEESDGTGTSG